VERVNVHVWVRAEDVRAYRAAGLVPNSAVTALAQALDRVPLPNAPRRLPASQLPLGGLFAPEKAAGPPDRPDVPEALAADTLAGTKAPRAPDSLAVALEPSPWLERRERPAPGTPVRWRGQDGTALSGVAGDRGLIATHRAGTRLRALVEFAFGKEWPAWEPERGE